MTADPSGWTAIPQATSPEPARFSIVDRPSPLKDVSNEPSSR
jgi:hypothetical protein